MRFSAIPLLTVPLLLACSDDTARDSSAVRRDSAGIAIVEQMAPALEPVVFVVTPEPLLVLESDELNPERVLHDIRTVVSTGDGFAVANGGASQLWFCDARGNVLRVSGGPGEGPGEFSGMVDMHALPSDSLMVDARGRFHVVAPDGAYARTFQLLAEGGQPLSYSSIGVVGGHIIVQNMRGGEREQLRQDVSRVVLDVLRFDLDGRLIDTLATVPGWEAYTSPAGGMTIANMPIPFGRSVWIAASPAGVLTASSYDNELRLYDANGEPTRIIRNVAPPPGAVTDQEVAAFKERMLEGRSGPMRDMFENTFETMPAATTHPPFQAAHLGTDGTMWVVIRTVPHDGTDLPAIVYDSSGNRLGGALLPSSLEVKEISLDRVLGIWTDSLGVESVRAYGIERRSQ